MDRKEAADLLDNLIGMVDDSHGADYDTALKMGIEALSAQPTEASCWGCNCPKMERLKVQKTFSEMVHLHDAEQQWIPCSKTEDLPKHEVLCCDKYGEELIGWLSYSDDQWLCESDGEMMYDPIAWREKPDPWRGAEHETSGHIQGT